MGFWRGFEQLFLYTSRHRFSDAEYGRSDGHSAPFKIEGALFRADVFFNVRFFQAPVSVHTRAFDIDGCNQRAMLKNLSGEWASEMVRGRSDESGQGLFDDTGEHRCFVPVLRQGFCILHGDPRCFGNGINGQGFSSQNRFGRGYPEGYGRCAA